MNVKHLCLLIPIWLAACAPAGETPSSPVSTSAAVRTSATPAPTVTAVDVPAPTETSESTGESSAPASPTAPPAITATSPLPSPSPQPATAGHTAEGAYYLGDPAAPVTIIDYSDFMWSNCRAYVLGTEPQVVDTFVDSGQAQIIFWPVLNHGDPSVYATLTAECVARQDGEAFWEIHRYLFENQNELWRADRDYFIDAAVQVGVDEATFVSCYDGGDALAHVMDLDRIRRERGIYSQPVFDVNGELFYGSQSFQTFSNVIENVLSR